LLEEATSSDLVTREELNVERANRGERELPTLTQDSTPNQSGEEEEEEQ
jgi:hypothetical protein